MPRSASEIVGLLWEVVYADGRLARLEETLLDGVGEQLEIGEAEREAARAQAFARVGRGRPGPARRRNESRALPHGCSLRSRLIAIAAARDGRQRRRRHRSAFKAALATKAPLLGIARAGRAWSLSATTAWSCFPTTRARPGGRRARSRRAHADLGGFRRRQAGLGGRPWRHRAADGRRRRNLDAHPRRRRRCRAALGLVRERGPRHRRRRVRLRDGDRRRRADLEGIHARRRRRPRPPPQRDLRAPGGPLFIAAEAGTVFRSTDGGATWIDAAPAVRGLAVGRHRARATAPRWSSACAGTCCAARTRDARGPTCRPAPTSR